MASVALVFGGTGGLGKAIATKLLNADFKVALTSRVLKTGEICAQELISLVNPKHGTEVVGLECHVASEQSVQQCFNHVQTIWTSPSVVVNATGVNDDQLLVKVNVDTMWKILETNLLGAIIVSKIAARNMMRKRSGTIINIGSVVATAGNVGQTVYGASKAGLIGLTSSLAKEVGSRNIRVNLVSPGFIQTRMTDGIDEDRFHVPLNRFGRPEEVADVVHFLIGATYITGQVITVDGGLHLC